MRFLIDAMLPPDVAAALNKAGHDAVTPSGLGAHNLADDTRARIAADEHRVIVTENARDFAEMRRCPVLFVRKSWWPGGMLTDRLTAALDRWALANPDPGPWSHWLAAELR